MNRTLLVIFNTITFVLVIIINYLAGDGYFNNTTVGEISYHYDSLFAPAGYAFSIWGLIYLMLIAFVIFQWYAMINKKYLEAIERISGFFILSNVANATWLMCWLYELIGLSVIVMIILLLSLIAITIRHKLELYDAPKALLFFSWWPFSIYLGWIVVATVANIAAYLNINWNGEPLTEVWWTIIMMIIATIIYLLLIQNRNMREAAIVGVWALIAIAVRHWQEINLITYSALFLAIIILIATIFHAYKNRRSLPGFK